MDKPSNPRYQTQYNVSLTAREALTAWMDKHMTWSGKRGRNTTLSDATSPFCLTLKNLFGLMLRQVTELGYSVWQSSRLAWLDPNLGTLCKRYTRAVKKDSTELELLGEGECMRHVLKRRHQWHKLHIDMMPTHYRSRPYSVACRNVSDATVVPDLYRSARKMKYSRAGQATLLAKMHIYKVFNFAP